MSHHPGQKQPSHLADPNTTFIQADAASFRTIVQKLTGAPPHDTDNSSTSMTTTTDYTSAAAKPVPHTASRKAAFKLHERRKTSKAGTPLQNLTLHSPDDALALVSPVSHLDPFWSRASPQPPRNKPHAPPSEEEEEEERAIAEKGFYLRKSPRGGGRAQPEPELLPLFPLRSPGVRERD